MKVLYSVIVTLFLTAPCLLTGINAQGWEFHYPIGLNFNTANDLILTNDGGYILAGESTDFGPISGSVGLLIKLDAEGDSQWVKALFPEGSFFNGFNAIANTDDGGFIAAGSSEADFVQNLGDLLFAKYDSNGDTLWTNRIDLGGNDSVEDVQVTSDGGYISTGWHMPVTIPLSHLTKTDASGNLEWTQTYDYGGFMIQMNALDQTDDGGYVMAGARGGILYIIKTDAAGDSTWTKSYPGGTGDALYDIKQTSDGGYIVTGAISGFAGESPIISKIDANGDEVWTAFAELTLGLGRGTSVIELADGSFVVTGRGNPNSMLASTGFLTKFDANGNPVWGRTLNDDLVALGHVVKETNDGGFIVGGEANSWSYAMKTNADGIAYSVYLKGNVHHDPDLNCLTDDAPFSGLENWIVEAFGDNGYFYGVTDENGDYEFVIDTGSYNVTAIPPSPLWSLCDGPQQITMPMFYDTTTVDFFVGADVVCPVMDVDISTPLLRRCLDNTYYVVACNNGTTTATEASVDVTLDPFFTIVSTTLPIASQDGDTYTFDIGDVEFGDCVNFSIVANLSCDAELGQTHCTEAHVFPDSTCVAPPGWDMASIIVEAVCEIDSVRFYIRNIGDGNMSTTQHYLVIEDQIILYSEPFMLDAGQEISFAVPANGSTWRVEADQSPNHPGFTMPSATVEGCTISAGGPFSMGFVIQYPENNLGGAIDIDCQESIGSFDPNDKRGFPKGYGEEHYITDETSIDYHIRFQNTGTDTAFLVVIRDTISDHLDISTLQMGAVSHPYELSIHENVLKFTFDNIMLPDSNVNEPASHGFVKFKIGQRAGNENGTVIYNDAAIYFDFNAPIITNETYHTIGEDFIEEVIVSVEDVQEPGVSVNIAPNPFYDVTYINLEGKQLDDISLQVFDGTGRLVRNTSVDNQYSIMVTRDNLTAGVYFFRILSEGRLVVAGKLIVQ